MKKNTPFRLESGKFPRELGAESVNVFGFGFDASVYVDVGYWLALPPK
jgi:hypothetical protein